MHLQHSPLLTTLLVAAGCSGGGPAAMSRGPDGGGSVPGALQREAAPKVLVQPVVQREMVRELSTTTVAESEKEIEVFPRTSGVVTELRVEEGDRVRSGDVLLVLDRREAEAALEEAEIALREAEDAKRSLQLSVDEARERVESARLTYEQARRELERKESAGQGLLSKNELEQLRLTRDTRASELEVQKHALASAEAAVTSQDIAIDRARLMVGKAKLDLSYTEVTAPFDGVVAERKAKVGDLVSNATSVFVLTDADNVRAVVYRPQRELAFFHAAERALRASDAPAEVAGGLSDAVDIRVEPEAIPDAEYTGSILFVSPTIDAESGQVRLTIGLEQPGADDPRPRILPGMLLRVSIVTERHPDALVVPKRALLREGDDHFLFVVADGHARRLQVEEGFADDTHLEVHPVEDGALAPGDLVVVVGNRDLEDQDEVDAEPWQPLPVPGPGSEPPEGEDRDGPDPANDDADGEELASDSGGAVAEAPDADVPDADAPETGADGTADAEARDVNASDGGTATDDEVTGAADEPGARGDGTVNGDGGR